MAKRRISALLAAAGLIGTAGLSGCRTSGGYEPAYRSAAVDRPQAIDPDLVIGRMEQPEEDVAPDPDARSSEPAPYLPYEESLAGEDSEPSVAPPPVETAPVADAQQALADALAALRELGGTIRTDDAGRVVDVDLSGTKFTDADVLHLAVLVDLEQLSLRGTEISDSGLRQLTGLDKLQLLDVGKTRISDAGLQWLRQLDSLQYLLLGQTHVTEAGVPELRKMTKLQGLSLVGIPLSVEALAALQTALSDCQIVADTPAPRNAGRSNADDEAIDDRSLLEETRPLEPVPAEEFLPAPPSGRSAPPAAVSPGAGTEGASFQRQSEQPAATTAAATGLSRTAASDEEAIHYRRGLQLARAGEVEQAFEEFSLVLTDAEARYTLGVMLYRNALEASEEQFLQALELNPADDNARFWVGEVRRQRLRMPHTVDPLRIARGSEWLPLPMITPHAVPAAEASDEATVRPATATRGQTRR